jgi:hypothetical protein
MATNDNGGQLNSIGTIIVIDTNVTNGSPMPPLAFCK